MSYERQLPGDESGGGGITRHRDRNQVVPPPTKRLLGLGAGTLLGDGGSRGNLCWGLKKLLWGAHFLTLGCGTIR